LTKAAPPRSHKLPLSSRMAAGNEKGMGPTIETGLAHDSNN